MSCPWANIEKSEPVGLEQIISEEVARNLQTNNKKRRTEKVVNAMPTTKVNDISIRKITETDDCGSDATPQVQFSKEYKDQLDPAEAKCSGSSIDNFSGLSLDSDFEEEDILILDEKNWDVFDPLDKEFAGVSRNAFKRNKKMENEEYATINGGKSMCKLSSKIFNSPELPSYKDEFRKCKVHRDKQKRPSYKLLSIDPHAWRLIREMIKDQVLHKVVDVLSFGREAVILRGVEYWPKPVKPKGCSSMTVCPPWCMIKVFKMNLKLGQARLTACQRAEREAANYKRLKAAGVPCLNFIAQKEHVLVTSYCGQILKDFVPTYCDFNYRHIYNQVKILMKSFYEANFIHADLSERDVVWCWDRAYIINISHCVERTHSDAFDYLFRDCTNIVNFFNRKGLVCIESANGLFRDITGHEFLDKASLSELMEVVKTEMT